MLKTLNRVQAQTTEYQARVWTCYNNIIIIIIMLTYAHHLFISRNGNNKKLINVQCQFVYQLHKQFRKKIPKSCK